MRSARPPQDRKFGCHKCDKKFFTPKDLRRHENTHLGLRDHVCPSCQTRFGRKDHLTRHAKKSCSAVRSSSAATHYHHQQQVAKQQHHQQLHQQPTQQLQHLQQQHQQQQQQLLLQQQQQHQQQLPQRLQPQNHQLPQPQPQLLTPQPQPQQQQQQQQQYLAQAPTSYPLAPPPQTTTPTTSPNTTTTTNATTNNNNNSHTNTHHHHHHHHQPNYHYAPFIENCSCDYWQAARMDDWQYTTYSPATDYGS